MGNQSQNLEGGVRKQRKKGEVKFVLLSVLSFDSEPLADIRLKVKALGYDLSYDRVRTQLWSFKNDGLVESPEKGHYCWTEKGAAYVQSHKGESPVDAGLSSATMSGQDELRQEVYATSNRATRLTPELGGMGAARNYPETLNH